MTGTVKVRQIGNSLGVLIPQYVTESFGIKAGTLLLMYEIDDTIHLKVKRPTLDFSLIGDPYELMDHEPEYY